MSTLPSFFHQLLFPSFLLPLPLLLCVVSSFVFFYSPNSIFLLLLLLLHPSSFSLELLEEDIDFYSISPCGLSDKTVRSKGKLALVHRLNTTPCKHIGNVEVRFGTIQTLAPAASPQFYLHISLAV